MIFLKGIIYQTEIIGICLHIYVQFMLVLICEHVIFYIYTVNKLYITLEINSCLSSIPVLRRVYGWNSSNILPFCQFILCGFRFRTNYCFRLCSILIVEISICNLILCGPNTLPCACAAQQNFEKKNV